MSDYLPPELYPMILLKLPIKSVIKCTSVCKLWLSIITSPAFISGNLSLSRQNPPLLLSASTTIPCKPDTFVLHSDTDPPPRLPQTLPFPFRARGDAPFRVVGSVDGLILLSDDDSGDTYTMFLWNPSIRKSATLPNLQFNSDEVGLYSFMLGFGAINDHKVVRLAYLKDPGSWYNTPPLVEVFSLRDWSWKTVSSANVDYHLLPTVWGQCFIHGVVHWIGHNHLDTGILFFDFGTEEFHKMALPDENVVSPSVIWGMLSVLFHHDVDGPNIWVKRDYFADSWTKMLSIDVKKLHLGVLLNLKRVCAGDWRDIQVPLLLGFGNGDFVISYTESLVLLDQDRAIQEAR